MSIVQEEIARDLYDMAAAHREEISQLVQEFDKHEIDTSTQLHEYEHLSWVPQHRHNHQPHPTTLTKKTLTTLIPRKETKANR